MGKKRVYEIAKDEGLPSSLVLQRLQRGGMGVKTASSTIDVEWALHTLNPKRYPKPGHAFVPEPERPSRAKPAPEPPEPVAEEPERPRPTRPRPRPRPRVTEEPAQATGQAQAPAQQGAPAAPPQAAPAATPAPPAPEPVAQAPAEAPARTPEPEAAAPVTEAPAAPAPEAAPVAERPAAPAPPAEAPQAPAAPAAETPPAQPAPQAAPVAEPPAAVQPPPAQAPAAEAPPAQPPAAEAPPAQAPAAETPPAEEPKPEEPRRRGPRIISQPDPEEVRQLEQARANRLAGRGPGGPGGRPGGGPGGRPGGPGAPNGAGAGRGGQTGARPGGGPAGPGGRPGGGPGGPGGAPRPGGGPGARPGGGPGGPGGRPGGGPGGRPGGGPGGPGGPGGRGRPRRVVIDAQAGRRGGGPAGGRRGRGGPSQDREAQPAAPVVPDNTPVEIASGSTVKQIADALSVPAAQIIKAMMGMGDLVTLTQSLSDEAIELLGEELSRQITVVSAEDEADREETYDDAPEDLVPRAPVVTVMGHVDHGKTSLLDAIRKTEVAAGEAGGITQHIGAYQVHHGQREITFLDTPGHEAFTAMRARGAKITDVAVIVVAADDGVMPQTLEAIDHARAAEVPFMVAVNKIDKPGANPDRVRQELSQREVIPSDWGGTHEFVNVSALEGTGLEDLLETVLLVADADAEPKGNPKPTASGTVIESRLDPGRGPVCTLLVQRGTLRVGDVIIAGEHHGRVRAMNGFSGEPIEEAGPSAPAEILGLSGVPDAGDRFKIVDNERTARQLASQRSHRLRAEELANRRAPVSLDDLFARIKEGGLKELNIIVKGDVQGSVGALTDALNKVEQTEVRLRIIHTGVGAITESDVNLAAASQAIIIGFNVRPRPEAKLLGEREGVDIRTYRVIYRAIEDVRDALVGLLEPDIVEDVVGQAEVRAIFRSSRLGTIAGCYVTDGVIRRSSLARLLRDGTVVHEGRIGSLRRVNDDVREVLQGFECGILLEDYNDVKDGDVIEAYEQREVARTAQAPAAAPAPPAATATAGAASEGE